MSEYSTAIFSDMPVVYYRLDELSGTVASDQSGNGYDGTYQGNITYSVTGAIVGDSDTAILFPGQAGILFWPSTINPATWTQRTIELWIKITGGWHYVVVVYDGTTITNYLDGSVSVGGSGDKIVVGHNLEYIGSFSNATLDEVALYNSTFTAGQVAWRYNIGLTGRNGLAMLPATYRRDGTFPSAFRRGI